MRHLIDDVFRSPLPVNGSVPESYGRTFFLRVKSADFRNLLRIILGIIVAVVQSISKKRAVHVVASNGLSLGNLRKIVQSDCLDKLRVNDASRHLTVSRYEFHKRQISFRNRSGLVAEQNVHVGRIRKSGLMTYKDIFLVH